MVWAIPKSEREARARFDTDLCEFDGRFFIRGVLYIPLLVPKIFNVDASNEAPINGALAIAIPGYQDALNERLLVKFGNSSIRPEFHLDPFSKSTLAKDQHTGIDDKRYHDMVVTAGAFSKLSTLDAEAIAFHFAS